MGLTRKKAVAESMEKAKLELIKWVAGLDDNAAVQRLTLIKNSDYDADWWDELPEAARTGIIEGLEDARKKRTKSHKEMKRKYGRWLRT